MKNRRLIAELILTLVFAGVLWWQQRTIAALRQPHESIASAAASPARGLPAPEALPKPGKKEATTLAASTVAELQAENRTLREQNEALGARQRAQAGYSTELVSADSALSGLLVSSAFENVSTRPPDTTGLRPDGQVAAWSPRQAIGAPDTQEAGDVVTAWASRGPDAGEEWLQLNYGQPVDIAQINVHETYNPGAVSRITALMPDGSEQTLWEGTEPPEEAPVEVGFPIPKGVRSDQIKVYVDTARIPGWNEIDAVELVGSDGSRQWASGSSASSYYGDRR